MTTLGKLAAIWERAVKDGDMEKAEMIFTEIMKVARKIGADEELISAALKSTLKYGDLYKELAKR